MKKQNNVTITYGITVCTEETAIRNLLTELVRSKRECDDIVILHDIRESPSSLMEYLSEFRVSRSDVTYIQSRFNGSFADWKNELNSHCKGDFIFQIDADEIPATYLIEQLPGILEANPGTDMYLVPRVNTVLGITEEHIQKWKWNINKYDWINWPDYQWRIYRNSPNITWKGIVHEWISGHQHYTFLPAEDGSFALYHAKTIERQEKQNAFYETLS